MIQIIKTQINNCTPATNITLQFSVLPRAVDLVLEEKKYPIRNYHEVAYGTGQAVYKFWTPGANCFKQNEFTECQSQFGMCKLIPTLKNLKSHQKSYVLIATKEF